MFGLLGMIQWYWTRSIIHWEYRSCKTCSPTTGMPDSYWCDHLRLFWRNPAVLFPDNGPLFYNFESMLLQKLIVTRIKLITFFLNIILDQDFIKFSKQFNDNWFDKFSIYRIHSRFSRSWQLGGLLPVLWQ